MNGVKWGEFKFKDIFNHIEQGRRLKKEDQKAGNIPFIMAGTTNTGVVGYISNPVASFPSNSITIDIFGNTFYRNFDFGAGDDTGVYWNDEIFYSENIMLFFVISIQNSLKGKFSFGKKLRSSQSFDFKISLPLKEKSLDFSNPCDNIKNIDFDFMESFISELEEERISELNAYLTATGLSDYTLTSEEENALEAFKTAMWGEFEVSEIFDVRTSKKRFDANKIELVENCGHPYVVRTALNNGIKGYLNEAEEFLNDGNSISFGQDTATMYYQEVPYFTGDKIKILKSKLSRFNKSNAQFFLATMRNSFQSFSWGSSSFNVSVIANQTIQLPIKENPRHSELLPRHSELLPRHSEAIAEESQKKGEMFQLKPQHDISLSLLTHVENDISQIDFDFMETFIKAVEKLVIKDVVLYADSKIAATKKVVAGGQAAGKK